MARVPDDLMQRLRDGKAALRLGRRNLSLEEKLRELVRAQRMYAEITASRRALKPWERPWNILSDVRDAVILRDGIIESRKVQPTGPFSASSSHWVRPHRWEHYGIVEPRNADSIGSFSASSSHWVGPHRR